MKQAASGPVAEGSVGAGTGLITCDFQAGIGTSSRRVAIEGTVYTVGLLVQSNFGVMRSLRVDGAPESRKTAKIRAGQKVECRGVTIVVAAPAHG